MSIQQIAKIQSDFMAGRLTLDEYSKQAEALPAHERRILTTIEN